MGELYLVATPIGNLEDISYRAVRILAEVDMILCEDTRTTSILCERYDIGTRREKFNAHTENKNIEKYLDLLESGKNIALVSDAGTPSISDPGMYFVKHVREAFGNNIKVTPIPGASALSAIVSVVPFSMDGFYFEGFMPLKKGRNKVLTEILERDVPTVVFESPHRIAKLMEAINEADPETEVLVGRELTKIYEEILFFKVSAWREYLRDDNIRGEFTLVIKPNKSK